MNQYKKIKLVTDTLIETAIDSVPSAFVKSFFENVCGEIDSLQHLAYLGDSEVFTTAESYERFIAASAQVNLISLVKEAILADGEVDDDEIDLAVKILAPAVEAIKRVDPTYKQFSPLTEDELGGLCEHFESNKSFINPVADDEDLHTSVFEGLCCASALNTGTDSLFNLYERLSLLAYKMIVKADGVVTEIEARLFELNSNLFEARRGLVNAFLDAEAREGFLSLINSPRHKDLVEVEGTTSRSSDVGQSPEIALEKSLSELSDLIGLNAVKVEIQRLANYLQVEEKRKSAGLAANKQAIHLVFTGNPGTGKTTVARIMAKLLYGFNVLNEDKLIETERSGLVGGYVGQTAIKTKKVIDSALNGVLFVDEAYTLSGKGGEDFGQEAIDTMLKQMEDNRDSLVVIAAGYTSEMEQFLSSNPGLKSRFTRFIDFPDYNVKELCKIFVLLATKNQYELTSLALANVAIIFHQLYSKRGKNFGNGRLVRNLFEKTLGNHSDRIVTIEGLSKSDLTTISDVDLPYEAAGLDKPYDLSTAKWLAKCPSCEKEPKAKLELIGKKVKCKCGGSFVVPFWNLVPNSLELKKIVSEPDNSDMLLYD